MAEKNDYQVTEQFLRDVPVPEQTSTYKPVTHTSLLDLVAEALKAEGLFVVRTEYRSSSEGKIATVFYDISYGEDSEMGLRIAWQNSYNKQVSLKFAIGAYVFVCSNGSFFGDIGGFKKKHVGEVQTVTPDMIRDYVRQAKSVFSNLIIQREELKNIRVNDSRIARIVGGLYLFEDILTETTVAIVKRELKKPTHDYGAPNSAWDLYNHITFALKTIHPREYIDIHTKLHEYFVKAYGLSQPVTKTEINEKL